MTAMGGREKNLYNYKDFLKEIEEKEAAARAEAAYPFDKIEIEEAITRVLKDNYVHRNFSNRKEHEGQEYDEQRGEAAGMAMSEGRGRERSLDDESYRPESGIGGEGYGSSGGGSGISGNSPIYVGNLNNPNNFEKVVNNIASFMGISSYKAKEIAATKVIHNEHERELAKQVLEEVFKIINAKNTSHSDNRDRQLDRAGDENDEDSNTNIRGRGSKALNNPPQPSLIMAYNASVLNPQQAIDLIRLVMATMETNVYPDERIAYMQAVIEIMQEAVREQEEEELKKKRLAEMLAIEEWRLQRYQRWHEMQITEKVEKEINWIEYIKAMKVAFQELKNTLSNADFTDKEQKEILEERQKHITPMLRELNNRKDKGEEIHDHEWIPIAKDASKKFLTIVDNKAIEKRKPLTPEQRKGLAEADDRITVLQVKFLLANEIEYEHISKTTVNVDRSEFIKNNIRKNFSIKNRINNIQNNIDLSIENPKNNFLSFNKEKINENTINKDAWQQNENLNKSRNNLKSNAINEKIDQNNNFRDKIRNKFKNNTGRKL